jgi:murein DD-endopeptidase MepM/ murein hydrolase activator NlpD
VYIQHPGGQQTRYLHMSKFADAAMKAGPVKKGTLLGYVGSTGRSTGPHLHYGVYDKGSSVDPRRSLPRRYAGS